MSMTQEALKELLEAVEQAIQVGDWKVDGACDPDLAIRRAKQALAQPEQEPVANIRTWHKNGEQHAELWNWDKGIEALPDGDYDLYTTPPQRTWQGLTDEEVRKICVNEWGGYEQCRAIEAKLKQKNHVAQETN